MPPSGRDIIHTIPKLGRNRQVEVVEFVEAVEQRDMLAVPGCQAFQGYLYSQPLSAEVCVEYLLAHGTSPGVDRHSPMQEGVVVAAGPVTEAWPGERRQVETQMHDETARQHAVCLLPLEFVDFGGAYTIFGRAMHKHRRRF
jgi:hypothetical protein